MTFDVMTSGSQAAYARYKEVSKQTVTDWKSIGLVVFNDDGKVDFAATDSSLKGHGIRQPAGDDADSADFGPDAQWTKAEAERVKENYAALLKQLEYERESAMVVTIDDAAVHISDEYTLVRERIGRIGADVSGSLVDLAGAEEIKALIDAAVIAALTELSMVG